MNGRALNDRAIEVSPSSSRVSQPFVNEAKSFILTVPRFSIVLRPRVHQVVHQCSHHSHRRRTVLALETGPVRRAASPTSSVARSASAARSLRCLPSSQIHTVSNTAWRQTHTVEQVDTVSRI